LCLFEKESWPDSLITQIFSYQFHSIHVSRSNEFIRVVRCSNATPATLWSGIMTGRLLLLVLLFSGSLFAQVEVDGKSISPLVAVVDLNIPRSAKKEFSKASELIAKQQWTKAIVTLQQTTKIYPEFSVAYNNMAVAYAHLGDLARERDSLEKAISINDHFVLAYINLARMDISVNDFSHAQILLQRASALDPNDAVILILLGYSQWMDHDLDGTIATCRRAHSMAQFHAFAHRIAARALEQKNQISAAAAELQLFLSEAQPGAGAESARQELAIVQSIPDRSPPIIALSSQLRLCPPDRCVLP
jgi:tetratricopeptide (TPR) repeat protein